MVDKELVNAEKGNFDDLKKNTVDPSDIIEDPDDPRAGKKRFLAWSKKKDEDGNDMWEAVGKDGTIYRVKDDDPKPVKKGKIEIV